MDKKIHKRADDYHTLVGATAKCGLAEFYIDEDKFMFRDVEAVIKQIKEQKLK